MLFVNSKPNRTEQLNEIKMYFIALEIDFLFVLCIGLFFCLQKFKSTPNFNWISWRITVLNPLIYAIWQIQIDWIKQKEKQK